jgi:hypothetical protein
VLERYRDEYLRAIWEARLEALGGAMGNILIEDTFDKVYLEDAEESTLQAHTPPDPTRPIGDAERSRTLSVGRAGLGGCSGGGCVGGEVAVLLLALQQRARAAAALVGFLPIGSGLGEPAPLLCRRCWT